MQIMQ